MESPVAGALAQDANEVADVAGDLDDVVPAVAAPRMRRQRRSRNGFGLLGPKQIFVIVAMQAGLFREHADEFPIRDVAEDVIQSGLSFMVGVAFGYAWEICNTEARGLEHGLLRQVAKRYASRAAHIHGFVEYPVTESAAMIDLIEFRDDLPEVLLAAAANDDVEFRVVGRNDVQVRRLGDIVQEWSAQSSAKPILVNLVPQLAMQVVLGQLPVVHAVALTKRLTRSKLLVSSLPSPAACKRFIEEQELEVGVAARSALPNRLPVELVIGWLAATRDIKSLHKINRTSKAFAKLFARGGRHDAAELLGNAGSVGRETLRRSRVRLDATAMLIFRRRLSDSVIFPCCYLFADASPQWRGQELFAASIDTLWPSSQVERRLMPLVRIDRRQLSLSGKVASFVWQLFLLAGSNLGLLERLFASVRSVTTDMGTERGAVDSKNVLRSIMKHAYPRLDVTRLDDPIPFLFPHALQMPGWRHLIDGMIRRGLFNLPWFPHWLERFKAVVSFFRDVSIVDDVARQLRSRGFHGLASAVGAIKLTSLAEWRWSTLGKDLHMFAGLLESIGKHFETSWCGVSRDAKRTGLVAQALKNNVWHARTTFLTWFCCNLMDPLLNWVGGCDCHEHLLRRGIHVTCIMKGRRIASAYSFAMGKIAEGVDHAASWDMECEFGHPAEGLARQAVGTVRAVKLDAERRLEFLDRIPWLCSRLHELGVASRCLAQWEQASPAEHHRVSAEFLSPEGECSIAGPNGYPRRPRSPRPALHINLHMITSPANEF